MLFCRHRYIEWNLYQNFTPACAITIASFVKVKISLIFKLASTMSSGFLLLLVSHDGSGLTIFVHRAEADSLPS